MLNPIIIEDMLSQLIINNFAIIDRLEINFKDGLTVLTGETGAGKSIIADALDFLLGCRANADLIKTGTSKAIVEGTFSINAFDIYENQIIISRELTTQGSKAKINGLLANVSHLLYLRERLIDIHEQSSHIELLKPEKQLEILDNFGDASHKKIIDDYKVMFEEFQNIKAKLNYIKENKESILKKIDFLKFQVNEIKSVNIKDLNEENELERKREILLNKKELLENANLIFELINGNNAVETLRATSLQGTLSEIKKTLGKSKDYDDSFEPYLEIIENITEEIKDLSSFVGSYREAFDSGDESLNEIEERLDLFYRLKRKYGKSLSEIQEYQKQIQNELNNFEGTNDSKEEIEKLFELKEKEMNDLAERLTKSREQITREFVNKINGELKTLGFKHAIFVIEFLECELSSCGKEQIQFLFTANPDEPPKPLLKVISGGELSRVMLAIKSVSVRADFTPAPTMVFDEIDMGVSGEIAASVAKKLYKISRQNQTLCITHQPIIASMADSHFVIEKNIKDGTTQIVIKEVTQNEKINAIAILLTPEKQQLAVTRDAKEFAKSLIENAERMKEKELLNPTYAA